MAPRYSFDTRQIAVNLQIGPTQCFSVRSNGANAYGRELTHYSNVRRIDHSRRDSSATSTMIDHEISQCRLPPYRAYPNSARQVIYQ